MPLADSNCLLRRYRYCALCIQCVFLLTTCLSTAVGCRVWHEANDATDDELRLIVLTKLYVGYLQSHRNQPPNNEAEFKRFITESGTVALERGQTKSVDELFVSLRDGQPFVIHYGNEAMPMLDRGVVAYERIGKDGRRLVGYRLGFVEEVNPERSSEFLPAHE